MPNDSEHDIRDAYLATVNAARDETEFDKIAGHWIDFMKKCDECQVQTEYVSQARNHAAKMIHLHSQASK